MKDYIPESPIAMWSGILATLAYSIFGIQSNTGDRFTGTEAEALELKVSATAKRLERIEGQNAAFFVKEVQVRKQHDDLEDMVREVLDNQRYHCVKSEGHK